MLSEEELAKYIKEQGIPQKLLYYLAVGRHEFIGLTQSKYSQTKIPDYWFKKPNIKSIRRMAKILDVSEGEVSRLFNARKVFFDFYRVFY